jgi:hypothetical protein
MDREVRKLIREISSANPLWGALRIHGELLRLGSQVSQPRLPSTWYEDEGPPSPTLAQLPTESGYRHCCDRYGRFGARIV